MLAGIAVGKESLPPAETALATAAKPQIKGPSEADLTTWSIALNHPKYSEREKATAALRSAGAASLPHLAHTLQGKSLEAAERTLDILQHFSSSNDQPLQLNALELLVEANRFPRAQRQAESLLSDLHKKQCQARFEALGAQFIEGVQRITVVGRVHAVQISIDPKKWKGTLQDFEYLQRLRQVETLVIIAPMLDDATVKKIATMKSLKMLELIQTQASIEVVKQIKKERPELRIILRSRSILGVQLGQGGGLTISDVVPGSAAEKAGLEVGDFIQAINGQAIDHYDALTAHIAQHAPGDSITLTVLRATKEVTVTAILDGKDWGK